MVSLPLPPAPVRPGLPAARAGAPWRLAVALGVALILLAGVLGGLQRLAIAPLPRLTADASLAHAALMIGGWLGTLIGLERAVALKTLAARLAPALSAAGALLLVAGQGTAGAALLWAASTAFLVAHVGLLRRQRVAHHAVLLLGAASWWIGNARFTLAGGQADGATLSAWFGFLVLTIAAERLELTRLLRRPPLAQPLFFVIVGALLAGVLLAGVAPPAGGALVGGALMALAAWLVRFDVARITLRKPGLPRYMAVALLLGYGWLALGGLAWIGLAFGCPGRDAALHALGLGFVMSLVMAHAPVVLPAIAGVALRFGPQFYAPLALLQASLALRFGGWPRVGAVLNALTIVLFALTVLGAVRAAARQRPTAAAGRRTVR